MSDQHDPHWVLVPREPTREMLQAAFDSQQSATSALCRIIYRTMIASAPPPPADDRVASLQARVAELESERDEALTIKDEWRNSAVKSGIKAAEAALAARAPDDAVKLREALFSIDVYGSDTLSGRMDGPEDAAWYRDSVREMRDRARSALASLTKEKNDD